MENRAIVILFSISGLLLGAFSRLWIGSLMISLTSLIEICILIIVYIFYRFRSCYLSIIFMLCFLIFFQRIDNEIIILKHESGLLNRDLSSVLIKVESIPKSINSREDVISARLKLRGSWSRGKYRIYCKRGLLHQFDKAVVDLRHYSYKDMPFPFESPYNHYKSLLESPSFKIIGINNTNRSLIGRFISRLIDYSDVYLETFGASLFKAMFLGIRDNDTVNDIFKRSGLSPYLAISGFHIAILYGVLSFLIPGSAKISSILSIAFIYFYIILIGSPASALRAFFFLCISYFVFSLNRYKDPFVILYFSLFLQILFKPNDVFSKGLYLSYMAIYIITCFPEMKRSFSSFIKMSIRVQLLLTPILILFFNEFVPYAVVYYILYSLIMSISVVLSYLFSIVCITSAPDIIVSPIYSFYKILGSLMKKTSGYSLEIFDTKTLILMMLFIFLYIIFKNKYELFLTLSLLFSLSVFIYMRLPDDNRIIYKLGKDPLRIIALQNDSCVLSVSPRRKYWIKKKLMKYGFKDFYVLRSYSKKAIMKYFCGKNSKENIELSIFELIK